MQQIQNCLAHVLLMIRRRSDAINFKQHTAAAAVLAVGPPEVRDDPDDRRRCFFTGSGVA